MKHTIRLLLTLFMILCCTTIAGAVVQQVHTGVVFETACVLDGETHFSTDFVASREYNLALLGGKIDALEFSANYTKSIENGGNAVMLATGVGGLAAQAGKMVASQGIKVASVHVAKRLALAGAANYLTGSAADYAMSKGWISEQQLKMAEVGITLLTARVMLKKQVEAAGTPMTPSTFARSQQGAFPYIGIDRFRDITLKKGTIIYGGEPRQSAFYTSGSAFRRVGDSATDLWKGLQVQPHKTFGYRGNVTAYEVIDDVPAAFGRALENGQFGSGGLPQIVVPEFQKFLRPIHTAPLFQ